MPIKQVVYSREALNTFESEINEFGIIETGGVLMGYVKDETVHVIKASDGGPDAIHEDVYFRADPNYIDMFIDVEYANSGGKLRYLGEWHTHSQIIPEPSPKDLNSLYEIAESADDFCLLLIIGAINFKVDEFINRSITVIKHKHLKSPFSLSSQVF